MKLQPLHDRVIIKRLESETKSAGGIVIPDTAKEKPMKGEVVAVGKGRTLDSGQVLAPTVKVGDKVLIGKYAGSEFKIDDVEYVAVKEDEIIAIVGGK
ncbi:MAG TPA: co-chaperone GroES [Gammaproteobacteria bacterium]|nr:co-chaperone GroES [Gammaproteobacteria bacterium]